MRFYIFILTLLVGLQLNAQTPSDDALKLKKSEDALWYADRSFINSQDGDKVSAEQKDGEGASFINPKAAKNILTVLGYLMGIGIVGALVYAIYSFSETKRQKKASVQYEDEELENIENAEDLHKLDFIQKIKTTENYRLAIRYFYLWLLQDLSKNGLIKFEKNKTNRQYSEELKNHKKAADFNVCTRYYNYVWYGEHPVSDELYEEIVYNFKKLLPYA